jgi:hypothetical protein
MGFIKRMIDLLTLGSVRPMRRLAAYYVVMFVVGFAIFHFFPVLDGLLSGEPLDQLARTPSLLQDGMASGAVQAPVTDIASRLQFSFSTGFVLLSTLALMLPVTWVYMSARNEPGHNQTIVQVLIVLPMIVAGIVLIVRNSLALAFSLGGVVAAVRFRTNLTDARDIVFIFLAIAVGFAAGVQVISVALLSMLFNFVLVVLWRYDFGRSVLEPTAASQWSGPLAALAGTDQGGKIVPDRDLVIALTPTKVTALAERFRRVGLMLGSDGKKPRYNAIVSLTTTSVSEAQQHVESALERSARRWRLDEVITNTGKPSELYYLVRTRKSIDGNALLTAIRASSVGLLGTAEIEIGDALARESGEEHAEKKKQRESA